jgi:predicted aspartyl protease
MSHYRFHYDQTYDPPAPVIQILVRTVYSTRPLLSAFVDSGADGTVIPLAILKQIGARYIDKRNLIGVTGLGQSVGLYPVQIQIGEDVIYGVEAAGYGDEIVLGRDALNQVTMILEGPLAECELRI